MSSHEEQPPAEEAFNFYQSVFGGEFSGLVPDTREEAERLFQELSADRFGVQKMINFEGSS